MQILRASLLSSLNFWAGDLCNSKGVPIVKELQILQKTEPQSNFCSRQLWYPLLRCAYRCSAIPLYSSQHCKAYITHRQTMYAFMPKQYWKPRCNPPNAFVYKALPKNPRHLKHETGRGIKHPEGLPAWLTTDAYLQVGYPSQHYLDAAWPAVRKGAGKWRGVGRGTCGIKKTHTVFPARRERR